MRYWPRIALLLLLTTASASTAPQSREDGKLGSFSWGDRVFEISKAAPGSSRAFTIRGRGIEYGIETSGARSSLFLSSPNGEGLRLSVMSSGGKALDTAFLESWARACLDAEAEWQVCRSMAPLPDAKDLGEAWRRTALRLEAAYAKLPGHLGILQDLIAAYGEVNASEGDSPRGFNLRVLIPERLTEFEERVGTLNDSERAFVRNARAAVYFNMGLYPLVLREASTDEPADVVLRKALASLHADGWENVPMFSVEGKIGTYDVDVFRSTRDGSQDGLMIHQAYFIPHLRGIAATGRLWYTLSRQSQGQSTRYYLLGWVAGSSKTLAYFGTVAPKAGEIEERIRKLMGSALEGAR